ncbi:MAG: hypothetical protein J0I65_21475 [Variovorax sp.]|nr:hypothetical protein [Variovorax sp.]
MSETEPTSTRLQQRLDEQGPPPTAVREGISLTTIGLCVASSLAGAALAAAASWHRIDWTLVQSVPGTFWAALIVGPLTFYGVLLTNQSHDRRASAQIAADQEKSDKQLLHDADRLAVQLDRAAEEAQVEREADMRREVYLESAAEIVKANAFVGSMFKRDLENPDALDGLNGFAAASAKLQVVADQEKSDKQLLHDADRLAVQLDRAAEEAQVEEARAKALQLKLDELQQTDGVQLSKTSDEWTAQKLEIQRLTGLIAKAWADASTAFGSSAKARADYELFMRQHLSELADQAIKVLARLRIELGLDADEERMLEEATQMRMDLFSTVDQLMNAIGVRPAAG